MIFSLVSGVPSRFSWTRGGISRASFSMLSASCYRFTRLAPLCIGRWPAECVDRDIPPWLFRYQEKFRGPMPEGEEIPDSPVSSPPPGTLVDTPRPKRRRGRPRNVPGSTSTNTQSLDLSY